MRRLNLICALYVRVSFLCFLCYSLGHSRLTLYECRFAASVRSLKKGTQRTIIAERLALGKRNRRVALT